MFICIQMFYGVELSTYEPNFPYDASLSKTFFFSLLVKVIFLKCKKSRRFAKVGRRKAPVRGWLVPCRSCPK